jgi:hypothetical protein
MLSVVLTCNGDLSLPVELLCGCWLSTVLNKHRNRNNVQLSASVVTVSSSHTLHMFKIEKHKQTAEKHPAHNQSDDFVKHDAYLHTV